MERQSEESGAIELMTKMTKGSIYAGRGNRGKLSGELERETEEIDNEVDEDDEWMRDNV